MTARKCRNSVGMCESSMIIDELLENQNAPDWSILTIADLELLLLPLEDVLIGLCWRLLDICRLCTECDDTLPMQWIEENSKTFAANCKTDDQKYFNNA